MCQVVLETWREIWLLKKSGCKKQTQDLSKVREDKAYET